MEAQGTQAKIRGGLPSPFYFYFLLPVIRKNTPTQNRHWDVFSDRFLKKSVSGLLSASKRATATVISFGLNGLEI
jgi:hypothetical protein